MKKVFLCLIVLLSCFYVNAQEKIFSNVLFNINLRDLTRIIADRNLSNYKDVNILIDGIITEIRIDNKNNRAEVDIVSGEWFGLDEVKMYQVTALITDENLFSRIPKTRRDSVNEYSIVAGKKIIGIVSLVQSSADNDVRVFLKDIRIIN
ncbi:hypothetical protein WKV44_01655 [Spirochaetia bacterium 38H-sp]|uniref:DUF5666 domain-containing protein n=1 Tax=Rarispira pelagica TaxID=3141764 RepID=A0ABU9U994_9SPIR